MKASCLAFACILSIVPAAAEESAASQNGLQADDIEAGRGYRLEWLRQKIANEDAAAASIDSTDPADAEFARKVSAMLALAKEQVRRAAASPDPVQIRVHLRCVSKRVVLQSETQQPFVPALEWSAAAVPAPTIVSKTAKACTIELTRSRLDSGPPSGPATGQGAQMRPYSIELPVPGEAAH